MIKKVLETFHPSGLFLLRHFVKLRHSSIGLLGMFSGLLIVKPAHDILLRSAAIIVLGALLPILSHATHSRRGLKVCSVLVGCGRDKDLRRGSLGQPIKRGVEHEVHVAAGVQQGLSWRVASVGASR